jgi:hypothetical protein
MTQDPPVSAGEARATHIRRERVRHPFPIRILILLMIVIILVIVAVAAWLILNNVIYGSGPCGNTQCPVGWVGGVPTRTACGTTAGALYFESVSITSTPVTMTTNTLGLKVIPTAGGTSIPNVAPPAGGSPCPTSGGFYIVLERSYGAVLACWTGGTIWTSPIAGTCPSAVGAALASPITIVGGQSLVVYMYGASVVPPMADAYTLQTFGQSGTSISVDL